MIFENREGQTTLLILLALSLVASRWNDVVKIGFGGFTAEMQKELAETTELVKKLRSVTKVVAEALVETIQFSGRWGGMPEERKDAFFVKLRGLLLELETPEVEIAEAFSKAEAFIRLDYSSYIRAAMSSENKDRFDAYFPSRSLGNEPSPDEIRHFLATLDEKSDEVNQRLEDYKFYCENKKHRRPELWARRYK
ncbi:MAG: hypothetical protein KC519_20345 [Anaerolineae bacterium]|nr:hypothetical protein [Anaerolineae bacterium]